MVRRLTCELITELEGLEEAKGPDGKPCIPKAGMSGGERGHPQESTASVVASYSTRCVASQDVVALKGIPCSALAGSSPAARIGALRMVYTQ